MAKPALGRGLGNLLGDTQIASKPEPAPSEVSDTSSQEVSQGLGNLLRAGKPQAEPAPHKPAAPINQPSDYTPVSIYKPQLPPTPPKPIEQPEAPPFRLPRAALIAADLLLIALASMLVFRSPAPLKAWEMAICVSAVILGALLACAACLNNDKKG